MTEFLKIRSKSFVFCPLERKLDAGKICTGSSERKTRCWEAWYWQYEKKNFMLGSLVLAVSKEKLDAGKLGTGSSERKNWMREACYWQFQKKKLDAGKLVLGIGSSERKN